MWPNQVYDWTNLDLQWGTEWNWSEPGSNSFIANANACMHFYIDKPNQWQNDLILCDTVSTKGFSSKWTVTVCLDTLDLPLVAFYKPTVQCFYTKLVWSQSSSCLLPSCGRVLFIDIRLFSLWSLHCVWFGASALQVCVRACTCSCVCVQPMSQCVVVETKYIFLFTFAAFLQDSSKSPRPMKKFLPGNRKKDRKPSDDDVQTRKSEDSLLLYGNLLGF